MGQRTLAHQACGAEIESRFGGTSSSSSIRGELGDHMFENIRVKWLYTDSTTSLSQTVENYLVCLNNGRSNISSEFVR
jgi:hypothetical protein